MIVTQTVRQGLVALLEDPTALNVSERAEAGRVLGRIGDTRKGVGLNDQAFARHRLDKDSAGRNRFGK